MGLSVVALGLDRHGHNYTSYQVAARPCFGAVLGGPRTRRTRHLEGRGVVAGDACLVVQGARLIRLLWRRKEKGVVASWGVLWMPEPAGKEAQEREAC